MKGRIEVARTATNWYASAFDVMTTQLPRHQNTDADLDLVRKILRPEGSERILDVGCGEGRHSMALAERGFSIVGVDISAELIDLAIQGTDEDLHAAYLRADLREIPFEDEFDLVLSFDGAIGYLEDDAENYRAFERIAQALRSGGRALFRLPSLVYGEAHLPEKAWEMENGFAELITRHWDAADRYMEGEIVPMELSCPLPPVPIQFRQRLYGVDELRDLFRSLEMEMAGVFDLEGNPSHPHRDQFEIVVLAKKL